jgi:hypothetical protein
MAWLSRYCTHDLPNKALKCPSCEKWLIAATYNVTIKRRGSRVYDIKETAIEHGG